MSDTTTCPHCGGPLNTPAAPLRPSFRPRAAPSTYRQPEPLPDTDDTDLADCRTCRHMHPVTEPCSRAGLAMPTNFRAAVHVFAEPTP